MKLSRVEMETIILYNEADDTANVYTHDPRLISKLEQLAMRNPTLFQMDKPVSHGAVSYFIPKRCVCIREPYSDARRKADSERAKKDGILPPSRTKCSKSE